jgi:hypothetical protein
MAVSGAGLLFVFAMLARAQSDLSQQVSGASSKIEYSARLAVCQFSRQDLAGIIRTGSWFRGYSDAETQRAVGKALSDRRDSAFICTRYHNPVDPGGWCAQDDHDCSFYGVERGTHDDEE